MSSVYALPKRFMSVLQTIRENGFGRTFVKINRKYHFMTDQKILKTIRLLKISRRPLDALKRYLIAKRLRKTSSDSTILSREAGFASLSLTEIPGAKNVIMECQRYIEKNLSRAQALMGKETFLHLLHEPHSDFKGLNNAGVYRIDAIPGLSELMIHPKLLEIASCYLGEVPVLASVVLYLSLPNETLVGSQRYHVDRESAHQLQFVFAVNDIDEETGPFTLIPAHQGRAVKAAIKEYTRLEDKTVYDITGEKAAVKLTGPSGSCWVVDTSQCLHYGSRHNKKIRYQLQIQYISRFASLESVFHFSKLQATWPASFTPLQKMVLADTTI